MNGIPSLHRITIWIEDTRDFQSSWDLLLEASDSTLYPAHGKPFPVSDLAANKHHINNINLLKLSPKG